MANPYESVDLKERERGTIMGWDATVGIGYIRADSGESVVLTFASVLQGFRQLKIGQRVEFSRMGYGRTPKVAALVLPLSSDANSPN